jgi:uncharacterized protein (DUF2336 family)
MSIMPHNNALQPAPSTDRRNRNSEAAQKIGPGHKSLVDELEIAIQQKNIGTRADILRRITDLFVAGSDHFDPEQMSLFDDVMTRLLTEIEHSARVAFGERLSAVPNAPLNASRVLALDDSIAVAGPVLKRSESLDDDTLVAGAKTKGQEHLLAISQRRHLSENVTDILVERGNQEVVISTAANTGAKFSQFGYSTLVSRSESDDELALTVWSRPEIPREYLLTLFETASETVRLKFETADRSKTDLVRDMIKRAADQIQTQLRDHSPNFPVARANIEQMHRNGELTEARVYEFASRGKFDETAEAICLLADLPIGAVERALVHDTGDQILILAKSIDFSWKTTHALLALQGGADQRPVGVSGEYLDRFKKLRPETARAAIQFYRLRERATSSHHK